jgi:hypothetical protein
MVGMNGIIADRIPKITKLRTKIRRMKTTATGVEMETTITNAKSIDAPKEKNAVVIAVDPVAVAVQVVRNATSSTRIKKKRKKLKCQAQKSSLQCQLRKI